jgi:3-deoxy-D-manno-octulosonate 8-phosphate phosphatase (KDO 8-P phosphatase)
MVAPSGRIIARAKGVAFLLLDVDGVLTDGLVTFTSEGLEIKSFHSHDGYGIKQLVRAGVDVGIVTARRSPTVERRATELGIVEVHQGADDKLAVYDALLTRRRLRDSEVAYVGDDVPDLPILKRVGFAVTVLNGHDTVKRSAHYTTSRRGGEGAVREVCDLLLRAKGIPAA